MPQRETEKETTEGERRGRTGCEASAKAARWSVSEMSPPIASSLDLSSVPASPLHECEEEREVRGDGQVVQSERGGEGETDRQTDRENGSQTLLEASRTRMGGAQGIS